MTDNRTVKRDLGPASEAGSPRYDFVVDPESDSTHARVIRLVGPGKRVLELGCATGYMTRILMQNGCRVVAIEMDADAAEQARPFCEKLIVGDIEALDLSDALQGDSFDVIVMADVLEHLKDPAAVLKKLKSVLELNGYLVASLPNIAHGSVRLALLAGQFPYSELGLLDRTHLRFFTHDSMMAMFESTGFAVGSLDRQILHIDRSEVQFDPSAVPVSVLDAVANDPDALTYQFIVVAYPVDRPELLVLLRGLREQAERADRDRIRAVTVERHLDELRHEHERLIELESLKQSTSAELISALQTRAETLTNQRDNLRTRLLSAHDQLVLRDDELEVMRVGESRLGDKIRLQQLRINELEREQQSGVREMDQLRTQLAEEMRSLRYEIEVRDQALAIRQRHEADLQSALDRILYSAPGRALRKIRSIVSLGRS